MAKKTRKFKTEVQQLLDLVIHSLYSKKEIFLRELISNASDAIDRARFEALTNKGIDLAEGGGRIELVPDKEARTLTLRDNGIGMSQEEIETNIGTIANSGTRKYLESIREQAEKGTDAEFIGQFGVGFYASFMVADRVDLVTRRAGGDEAAWCWSSQGAGKYTVEEATRDASGTDVILHIAEGQEEYLDGWRLKSIVRQYSNYIDYPIVLITPAEASAEAEEDGEKEDEASSSQEEVVNAQTAIWKKARTDVTDDEYSEFYKHVSHDMADPLRIIHYAAEGTTEFLALLFIPKQAPWDLHLREERKGIHLYVKNVFISDDCRSLLPEYLRFVRGVVDSSDLPLNVSREILQDDAIIRRIRKSLVGRLLKELGDLLGKDRETYHTFYEAFGLVFKEGITQDMENNSDKLKDLLLFRSTTTEETTYTTLKEYTDRMPSGQEAIYFLIGENKAAIGHAPHLEAFRSKGYEVLLLTDPIDEWMVQRLTEYDGKSLQDIGRGDIGLGDEEEKKTREEKRETDQATVSDLLDVMKNQLEEVVKDVRVSNRLTDSACCLVVDEDGMTPHMERIMRAMNQDTPTSKRILEVNADHPVLVRMNKLCKEDAESEQLVDYIDLLLGQALLTEGSPLPDPARFNKLVSALIAE